MVVGGELAVLGGDEPGKVARSSLRLLLKLSQSPVVRLNLSRRRKSKPASTEYSELSPVLEAWHPRPWHSPRRTRGSRPRRGARGRASLATGCKHRSGSSGLSDAAANIFSGISSQYQYYIVIVRGIWQAVIVKAAGQSLSIFAESR